MTTDSATTFRAKAWTAGFRPVPVFNIDAKVKSPGKQPLGKEWQIAARKNPPFCAVNPAVKHVLNTGILCDGLRVIDIDIDDATLASQIGTLAVEHLGPTITRWRENSGRGLLVYRAAEGSPGKVVLTGSIGKLEVLGYGQQFVADGLHPSGAVLRWRGGAPGDVALEALPSVTVEQIHAFLAIVAPLIGAAIPEPPKARREYQPGPKDDLPTDVALLASALAAVPNDGPADWEAWNKTGMAIWLATGGSEAGFEAWEGWSSRHPAYDARATEERWKNYEKSPPDRTGAGKIFRLARDAGWVPPANQGPPIAPFFTAPTLTLEEGRDELKRQLEHILSRIAAWHGLDPDTRGNALHAAIIADLGMGKSSLLRQFLVRFIAEAKAEGRPYRVLWMVPLHRLGNEAAADMRALGLNVAVLRGRDALDPDANEPGDPMCLNLPAVRDAQAIGENVETVICGKPDGPCCPFRATCAYQQQHAPAAAADVVILANNGLFNPMKKAIREGIALTVVDESFWQGGLVHHTLRLPGFAEEVDVFPVLRDANALPANAFGKRPRRKRDDPPPHWVRDPAATGRLRGLCDKAERVLRAIPEGTPLTSALLSFAGLSADECQEACKLEWRRKRQGLMHPGMSAEARRKARQEAEGNASLPARVGLWWTLKSILEMEDMEESGRIEPGIQGDEEGCGQIVRVHIRKNIAPHIASKPVVLLDAVMNPVIVRHYFPNIEVGGAIRVQAPHQKVTQITGGFGKTSLIPHGKAEESENKRRLNRLEHLRDFVALNSARNALVVTYQDAEPNFINLPGVATGHFNAIAGLDEYRNVQSLFVIGRPLPRPEHIRRDAMALTGKAFPHADTEIEERGVLRRDGTGTPVSTRAYVDPDLEAIRATITDAEVMQAIGRARGINRTEENPLNVFILADVILPLEVERVIPWPDTRPDRLARMFARGAALFSPGDAFRAYPGLFRSLEAARPVVACGPGDLALVSLRSILIGVSTLNHPVPVTYRPVGRGQQSRQAWVAPWFLTHFPDWLTKVVGPLVLYQEHQDVPGVGEQSSQKPPETKIPAEISNVSAARSFEPPPEPIPDPTPLEPLMAPDAPVPIVSTAPGGYGDAPATLPGMAAVPFSMVPEAAFTNRATGATATTYGGGLTIRTPFHPRRFIPVACPDDPAFLTNVDRPPAWVPPWERGGPSFLEMLNGATFHPPP